MKFTSNQQSKKEQLKRTKHRFKTGDVLKFGLDEVRINQVDLDTGMVYYSVSYCRPNKRPWFGWVMGPLLDNIAIVEDTPRTVRKAKIRGDDSEEVVKARVC